MTRLLVICVSLEMLSLVSAPLAAQSWQPAGFGAGGFFPQIMVDPADSSIVYLAADVSGLNKSTNYGDGWFKINSGLGCREVAAFAIDPANSLRLWAGTPMGLYTSADGGDSWSLAAPKLTCYINVNYRGIAINRAGTMLVAVHHQVDDAEPPVQGILDGLLYRSTDGGSNWTLNAQLADLFANTHTRFPAVVFDPYDGSHAFLLADGVGVLKSTDSGLSWSYFTNGLPPGLNWRNLDVGSNVVFATASPSMPYKSPKESPSWRLRAQGISGDESTGYPAADTIRISPADDNLVYLGQAGWPSVLYRSTNGGTNWVGIVAPDHYRFDSTNAPFQWWTDQFQAPICLAIDPAKPSRLYYSTWWGAWRSDDAGFNWVEKIIGSQNTVCTDVESSGGTLFSTHMDVGIYRSLDQGRTWLNCYPAPGMRKADLQAWSVKKGPGNMVYASITLPTAPALCRSSDQGVTWQVKTNGIYKPADFDMSWQAALAVDQSRTGTVYLALEYVTDNRAIQRSTDFGDTWAPLPSVPGSLGSTLPRRVKTLEADPTQADRLFAGLFYDGLWRTEDGGSTWTRAQGIGADLAEGSVQEIVALSNGAVFAAFDTGVYRSADHGRTFSRLLTRPNWGEQPALEYAWAVASNPDNTNEICVASAKNYPIWHNRGSVWHSTDNGGTWTDITGDLSVKNVTALSFLGGYVYAATSGANIYRYRVAPWPPPFRITQLNLQANGQVEIRWTSSPDSWYEVQVSTNLMAGFRPAARHLPAQSPENVFTDIAAQPQQKFYRVLLEP